MLLTAEGGRHGDLRGQPAAGLHSGFQTEPLTAGPQPDLLSLQGWVPDPLHKPALLPAAESVFKCMESYFNWKITFFSTRGIFKHIMRGKEKHVTYNELKRVLASYKL